MLRDIDNSRMSKQAFLQLMSVPDWVKHLLCLHVRLCVVLCECHIDLIRLCGNKVLDPIRLSISVVLDSAVEEQ